MPSEGQRKLTIKFDARGDKKLIAAINALARAQTKLTGETIKANAANKKYRHRVNSNTKGLAAQNAMMTKSQALIAQYRNKMLLAAFAITFVNKALVSFVKKAGVQEASVRRLSEVFGGQAAKELNEYSSQLQQVSIYGDEVINTGMALVGSFGLAADQTKELAKAAIDLAAGMGIDLNSSFQLIAKTVGSNTSALSRYGIMTDATASKTEKTQQVIDAITIKWGGLARALSETTEGQLAQASNAWGDFLENLGSALAPTVLAGAKALKKFSEAMGTTQVKALLVAVTALTFSWKMWNVMNLATMVGKRRFIKLLKLFRRSVIATKATTIAFAQSLKTAAYGQTAFNFAVTLGSRAMKAFTVAMAKNPIGILAIAVAAIGTYFLAMSGYFSDSEEELDEFGRTVSQVADDLAALEDAIIKSTEALQKEYDLLGVINPLIRYRIEQNRYLTATEYELLRAIKEKNDTINAEADARKRIDDVVKRSVSKKQQIQEELDFATAQKAILENSIEENKALIAGGADELRQESINQAKIELNFAQTALAEKGDAILANNENILKLKTKNEEKWSKKYINNIIKNEEAKIKSIRENGDISMADLQDIVDESTRIIEESKGESSLADLVAIDEADLSNTNKAITKLNADITTITNNQAKMTKKEQVQAWRLEMEAALATTKESASATEGATDADVRLATSKQRILEINKLLYKTDEDGNIIKEFGNEVMLKESDMIMDVTDATILLNNAKAEHNMLTKTQIEYSTKLTEKANLQRGAWAGMADTLNTMGSKSVGVFADSFVNAFDTIASEYENYTGSTEQVTEVAKEAWKTVGIEMTAMLMDSMMQANEARMQTTLEEGKTQLDALKGSKRYDKMSAKQKKEAEANMTAATNKKLKKQFAVQQQLNYASVIMDTSMAIMKTMATIPPPANVPIAVMTGVMGAVQLAEISKQKPPKMARGGLIKGMPHSQGGAMINAEGGEFVMSKRAVETAGIESMNNINRGQGVGAPVSVVFSVNINSDEFIESEAIPKIKEAIRRGADIGAV